MIREAGQYLSKSHSPVFFTGAGMSQESGVPTFRDAMEGLWKRFKPEELATQEAFKKDRQRVRDFYEHRRDIVRKCRPNAGHTAIAGLESTVSNVVVITQNVDGLHQSAGSTSVIPLHGNIMEDRCNHGCPERHPVGKHPATCPQCGRNSMRPDVVWFGEPIDEEMMIRSAAAILTSDVFYIIGTSGCVYPAANLAGLALQMGGPVIEINPERSPFSDEVTVFLPLRAGKALPKICRSLFDLA